MIVRRPSIIHKNRTSTLSTARGHSNGLFTRFFKKPNSRSAHTRLHRDYVRKTFVNPYYHKSIIPKRTKAKKTKMILGFLALAGIIGVFLFHPFFDVRSIIVEGNQKIQSSSIQDVAQSILNERSVLVFKEKNFFLLNTERIVEELKKHYAFDSIRIKKSPFSTLQITVSERAPVLVLKNGTQFYYIDKDGKSIGPADTTESGNTNFMTRLPQVWLTQEKQIALNDQVLSPATLQFILTMFKTVPDKIGITLQGATPQDEEGRIVHLMTAEGWEVYVDRQNDWDKQITTLKNILNIKFKDNNRTGLHYIDVRYENRVYIK